MFACKTFWPWTTVYFNNNNNGDRHFRLTITWETERTWSMKSGHSIHWAWFRSLMSEFRDRSVSWNSSARSLLQSTSGIVPAFSQSWVIDRSELAPSRMRDIRWRSTMSFTSTWLMTWGHFDICVGRNLPWLFCPSQGRHLWVVQVSVRIHHHQRSKKLAWMAIWEVQLPHQCL